MPRTRECDYCGDDIEPGTGTLLVRNDGSTVDYCSSKCEKNADLGREPREVEWTASGQAAGGPATQQAEESEPEPEPETEEADDSEAAPDLEAAEEDAEADEADAEDEEPAETDEADADTEDDEAEEEAEA
ncbi:50S ribosomal protein L24e [Halorientalis salina]|uniref:50S ribosomal protein L24e n=1 Tax=Halorientalis salina TaxID=2932266 RepID=UPI0010AC8291|nr:50S ribosomal protein L24e [Halorientalis salina]